MAEEVSISSNRSYIHVKSSGAPSLDEMAQTLSQILELSLNHNINKVLVDSRDRSTQPSVSDIYRGGVMLAEKLGYKIHIAVLVSTISVDHNLFENVAVNRGAIVDFFQQEEQALDWLLKNKN